MIHSVQIAFGASSNAVLEFDFDRATRSVCLLVLLFT